MIYEAPPLQNNKIHKYLFLKINFIQSDESNSVLTALPSLHKKNV